MPLVVDPHVPGISDVDQGAYSRRCTQTAIQISCRQPTVLRVWTDRYYLSRFATPVAVRCSNVWALIAFRRTDTLKDGDVGKYISLKMFECLEVKNTQHSCDRRDAASIVAILSSSDA